MLKGVLFDLDGVLTATDRLHTRAWRETCERWNIPFSAETAPFLRGVGRQDCVQLILTRAGMELNQAERGVCGREKRAVPTLLDELSESDVLPALRDDCGAGRPRDSHGGGFRQQKRASVSAPLGLGAVLPSLWTER